MRCFHFLLALVLLLPAGVSQAAPQLRVLAARVAEAPPVVGMHAGYFKIDNGTVAPVTLTRVSSPDFARVELHRSIIEDGVARMVASGPVTVAAHSSMTFKPGGYHLMLFTAVRTLHAGDSVTLRFHFAHGTSVEVQADIVRM